MKEWIKNKFEDHVIWRYKRIRDKWYDIEHGIKNLYRWFPVIWNDRGWDYCFMFAVMEKKFDLMIGSFEKGANYVVGCNKQIERLKICKEICRRLKDDWWYHENTFMFHDKKWGQLDWNPIEGGEYKISRENIFTEDDRELELRVSRILYDRENKRKEEDLEILLTYIKKYWKVWWW